MKKEQTFQKRNNNGTHVSPLMLILYMMIFNNLVARPHVPVAFAQTPVWIQLGGDIDGEAADDWSGSSVSLSRDGNVVAIGAPFNDGNGDRSGHVRVYAWDGAGSGWIQRGDDIDGEEAGDYSGSSVSLSRDGNVVAIGAQLNGVNGTYSGHVRVYEWDVTGNSWIQRGDDIDGEATDDGSGWSVSLSADGNVVAIGAPFNGGNGDRSGHVRVYHWDVDSGMGVWTQRGYDIDGEAAYNFYGRSVSLSDDGNVVAIGADRNDGIGNDAGHVRVYEWDVSDNGWTQRGGDIDGEAADDLSGWSVSLSADGNVLAIGAPYNNGVNGDNSGHVRVYEWDEVGSAWTQRGNDIDGEAASDESGWSVSLSDDGNVVAIGAYNNNGNGTRSGHVRVYEWEVTGNGGWIQRGDDIDGEATGDSSGYSVSLIGDGSVVAIGALFNVVNGSFSGHVRVYKVQADMPSILPSSQPSTSQTPSFQPSTSQTPSSQPSTSQTPRVCQQWIVLAIIAVVAFAIDN